MARGSESMNPLTGVREWLSTDIFVPLSRTRRWLRPSKRPALLAFYRGLKMRTETQFWEESCKRTWILQQLRVAVRMAYQTTSYYKDLIDRSGFPVNTDFTFDDFARFPVLTREQIHTAGARLVADAVPQKQLHPDATGGSIGVPTHIWLGPEERGWRESGWEFCMGRLGVPDGRSIGSLWGHHLDPVAADGWRDRLYNLQHNIRWFDCFRMSPEVLERYHASFQIWKPAVIIAYAGALGSLAEHVLTLGHRPQYPLEFFVTGAEKLLPHHRTAVEAAFGRPVHERYGGRDTGLIAFQSNPLHSLDFEVDWTNIMVEPETEDAQSSILVTKFHGDGMPMLRYRVGDLGLFSPGSHPGYPVLVLPEVIGRETDRIRLPNGSWVNGLELPHLLKDYPVREFALEQSEDYSIILKIVPKSGFGEDSRRQVLSSLKQNLPGVETELEIVAEVPHTKANKLRSVISKVRPNSQGVSL